MNEEIKQKWIIIFQKALSDAEAKSYEYCDGKYTISLLFNAGELKEILSILNERSNA